MRRASAIYPGDITLRTRQQAKVKKKADKQRDLRFFDEREIPILGESPVLCYALRRRLSQQPGEYVKNPKTSR